MSTGGAILIGGAGQAAGSAVQPAAEAGKGIYCYLKDKHDYVKNLEKNFKKLLDEATLLTSRERDVREEVERQNTMKPTHECITWLERVQRKMEEVEKLKTRYDTVVDGSCSPCHLHTRLKLSERIVKETKDIVRLIDQRNSICNLLTEKPTKKQEQKFRKNIIEVSSQCEHVNKLLEFLQDKNKRKIGILGMFGVGKSTILRSLKEKVEELHIFDVVLLVNMPKENDLRQMQEDILKQLALKRKDQSHAEELISKSLEGKKYLLLLDEVYSDINLFHIGFRESHDYRVVFATREKGICEQMETDDEILVEKLSKEDARKLFCGIVGEVADHPSIMPRVARILKQCGGLPQVIKLVGNLLKDKRHEEYWRSILLQLQGPIMYELRHFEDVITAFVAVYSRLDNASKNCLLYASSFPDDDEIDRDYLVECWMVEQLIGIYKTFREARDKGHRCLETLMDGFLFDKGGNSKHVKMPIILRNAARRMADESNFGLLVKDSEELEIHEGSYISPPPPEKFWRDAKVVSLMNCDPLLPHKPVCSSISTFCLQKNKKLVELLLSFFDHMSTLKLLDLGGTGIKSLPQSISNLTRLRGLYLNECLELMYLPREIEQLAELELLDLRHSGIYGFHASLGRLTHLKCLRVALKNDKGNPNSFGAKGTHLAPSNIIGCLPNLEELTIDADPKDSDWIVIAPKIALEMAALKKLRLLCFYFPTIESLEAFTKNSIPWNSANSHLELDKFPVFNISVGSQGIDESRRWDIFACTGKRYLCYSDGIDIPHVIKDVLGRTCAFELIAHQGIEDFSEFGIDNMEGLEFCHVERCNAMTTFFGSQMPTPRIFRCLRELHLSQLRQLGVIFQGPITSGSFAQLTTLIVKDCPNLTKLVSWELATELCKLQHLKVEKCPQIREILVADNQSSQADVLLKLKTLELVELEGLVSIAANVSIEWLELQEVKIDNCNRLVNLCLSNTNARQLKRFRCEEVWWNSLSDDVKTNLPPFSPL